MCRSLYVLEPIRVDSYYKRKMSKTNPGIPAVSQVVSTSAVQLQPRVGPQTIVSQSSASIGKVPPSSVRGGGGAATRGSRVTGELSSLQDGSHDREDGAYPSVATFLSHVSKNLISNIFFATMTKHQTHCYS